MRLGVSVSKKSDVGMKQSDADRRWVERAFSRRISGMSP